MPGPVYLDPWSPDIPGTCLVTDAMLNSTKGVLQKCHDTSTSTNCYQEVGDGHIIHNKYASCSDSWLLLPGFNLLPNWFLIGERDARRSHGSGYRRTPPLFFFGQERQNRISLSGKMKKKNSLDRCAGLTSRLGDARLTRAPRLFPFLRSHLCVISRLSLPRNRHHFRQVHVRH